MKIAISAESTVDLTKDLMERYDIKVVPFSVLLGDKLVQDLNLDTTVIFDYVEENNVLPKTSAVNEFQFEEHFKSLLKDYDAVIHFCLSSKMSSAYQNATNVAKTMENVYVIDSKSLSTGIALQCIYARKLAEAGLEPKDIVAKCEARIPSVEASFVLNTLDYLYRGGRCSSLARFGANLLRLKPQIIVSNGAMDSGKLFRGKNEGVVEDYCDATLEKFNNPDLSIGFVTHSHASPEMINAAIAKMKERGFKEVYVTVAGATISSHCGPKCIGILYINDGLKD